MSNSKTLIHAGAILTNICPSKCGKLNVRSFVLTYAPKIVTLEISSSGNVIVPSVNKSCSTTKNISYFSCMIPSIRS